MRIYLDKTKLHDELLAECVTDDEIEQTGRYLEDLALGLGVAAAKIVNPLPYRVYRLCECYCFMLTAWKQSRMNDQGSENGYDAYALKYREYKSLVAEYEALVTAEMLTGESSIKRRTFPSSIPIYRC